MKVIFVSFASGRFKKNIFWNRLFVRFFFRPDELRFLTDRSLEVFDVYQNNPDVFKGDRGGFYAWKPLVILDAIRKASHGDVIVYQDCGRGFKYLNFLRPRALIRRAREEGCIPGVAVPWHGNNGEWTHSICFKAMDCDEQNFKTAPQVEASVSLWRVDLKSERFVEEWLRFCCIKEAIAPYELLGEADQVEYQPHRWDQSILTNLVLLNKLRPLKSGLSTRHLTKSISLLELEYLFGASLLLLPFRLSALLKQRYLNFRRKLSFGK